MTKKKIVKKTKKPAIKVKVLTGEKVAPGWKPGWENLSEHAVVKAAMDIKAVRSEDYEIGKNDGIMAAFLWTNALWISAIILAAVFCGH